MIETVSIGQTETTYSDFLLNTYSQEKWNKLLESKWWISNRSRIGALLHKYADSNTLRNFKPVHHIVFKKQEMQERIKLSFFPHSQSIPIKVGPRQGDLSEVQCVVRRGGSTRVGEG